MSARRCAPASCSLASGLLPDVVHTSVLVRATRTAELALAAAGRSWIPVRRSWRLNERHYGALQGKSKEETRLEFGDEQFMLWRRSYDVPPPPLAPDSELAAVPRSALRELPPDALPATECLKDVLARVLPYWYDAIVPDLRAGQARARRRRTATRCARSSSISTGSPTREIAELNMPTGVPLLYELDERLRPLGAIDPRYGVSGRYLDPDGSRCLDRAVCSNQGGAAVPPAARLR